MPKLLESKALLSFVKASMPKGCKMVNANAFYWSPRTKTLHFVEERLSDATGQAALLHEACHALLDHTKYSTDAELLMLEVDAWNKAKELAAGIKLDINPEHIEDCLDTYREWLYARSTCPTCRTTSLQTDKNMYQCISCGASWHVSPSRFCRVYRMRSRNSKTPPQSPRTVFA